MDPFLHRLAAVLLERHAHELDKIAVVLPSRRAGMYLRNYLAKLAGRTIWSPDMLNTGAFMERMSGMRQGGSLEMLFMLYEAHKVVEGPRADPISEFMQWAPVSLRDLSEVDSHLLDLDELYRDLRSYEEIEEWSFRLGELSPGQERALHQWQHTGLLHKAFAQLMQDRKVGTSGYISRSVADHARAQNLQKPWSAIWFAGLNALDPATTTVARAIQADGLAFFAWDADLFYLNDQTQEAGTFLRRSIAALGPGEIPPVDLIRTTPRTFVSVETPNKVAEAKYVAQLINALPLEERSRTCVILAEEDLLMPFLGSLPADIGPLNITMGIPIAALPVHGLLEAFFALHASAHNSGYALALLERSLAHPFLHQGETTSRAITMLKDLQRMRPDVEAVRKVFDESGLEAPNELAAALLPMAEPNATEIPDRTALLIAYCKKMRSSDPMVQEQLFRMARFQLGLHTALERVGAADIDLKSYLELRSRSLKEEQLTFYGEPLSGMQIMGFLEARAIDHERVIILGASDGTLPKNSEGQSWIPFEIRRAYELPLPSDTEAITAYHFHRLAQHATELHLIYHGDDKDGTSPSRYIAQWEHEIKGTSATKFERRTVSATYNERVPNIFEAAKSDAVLQRLEELFQRGLSPSALSTWVACPLDFYHKYILRIREADEFNEKLGADVLGDAVHRVLEDVYAPFKGQALVAEDLVLTKDLLGSALHSKLLEKFPANTLDQGYFKLRMAMATQAMSSYVEADAQRLATEPTTLLDLELSVEAVLSNGTKMKGRCDRVEIRNDMVHILDMKTGNVQATDLVIHAFDREELTTKKRNAMQLLIYAFCYLMQNPSVNAVRAGIIPLQRVSQSEGLFLKVNGNEIIDRKALAEIDAMLCQLISELKDPNVPFMHDPEAMYCTCCATS